MPDKPYALSPGEKATQVMAGTAEALIWGDLVTKERVSLAGFMNTLAEDYVPLRDANVLLLTPVEKTAPLARSMVYVRLGEILLLFERGGSEPPPEETEVRRLEPIEVLIGPYQIEGSLLKSPIATMQNLLLVMKDPYLPLYQATIRHVAKPWLGAFQADLVQVRRDRLIVAIR